MKYENIKKAFELYSKWQVLCHEEQRVLTDFRVNVIYNPYAGNKIIVGSDETYSQFGIDGEMVREVLKDEFLIKMDQYATKLLLEMSNIGIETDCVATQREKYLKELKR